MSFEGWLNNLDSAKWIFAVAYVLSTIGVAIGVYLDSDTKAKEIKRLGERILLWSLVFDTLFTILIFATDGWISQVQNSKIIDLDWQNANLTTELLHVAMPRSLNVVAFKNALFDQRNASFEVLFDESSPDAPDLSLAIWSALKSLGWKTNQSEPLPLPPSPTSPRWVPRAVAAGGSQWGITVVRNKPMDPIRNGVPMTPATSPEFWLMAALGGAIGDKKEEIHSGVFPDLPDNTFRLVVGAKSPSFMPLLFPPP